VNSRIVVFVFVALLAAGIGSDIEAGVIVGFHESRANRGNSITVDSLTTPAVNNDDVAVSPNVVTMTAVFRAEDAVATAFEVHNSGGTTEYQFRIGVTPSSGSAFVFLSMAFDIWYGDFRAPESHLGIENPLTGALTDRIRFPTQIVPLGSVTTFVFALDVPDADGVPAFVRTDEGYSFRMQVSPFPEPTSVLLLGSGVAVLLAPAMRRGIRRARRRS
jgi:hypothetical protein